MHGGGVYGRGVCMAGGICGMGYAWQGDMHGMHVPPGRHYKNMVNERAVRILLECILVTVIIVVIFFVNVLCDGNNEMYYINSLQAQM